MEKGFSISAHSTTVDNNNKQDKAKRKKERKENLCNQLDRSKWPNSVKHQLALWRQTFKMEIKFNSSKKRKNKAKTLVFYRTNTQTEKKEKKGQHNPQIHINTFTHSTIARKDTLSCHFIYVKIYFIKRLMFNT